MAITALLIVALLLGLYVAWNIGANDAANSVGTAVGSGALTLKAAVVIAAIFEFSGAYFFGSNVAQTVEAGIVNPEIFSHDVADYVYGMMAALLAAGLWLQIASYLGLPVSTTHSIVGAVVGFGLAMGGMSAIFWGKIGSIAASWLVSPLLGGAVSYMIFSLIRRKILYQPNPVNAAKKMTPYLLFFLFSILSSIILFGGVKRFSIFFTHIEVIGYSSMVGLLAALIGYFCVKRIKEPQPTLKRQHYQVIASLKKASKHLEFVEAASLGEMQERVHPLSTELSKLAKEVEVYEEIDHTHLEFRLVERIFIFLQIVTACFMAFGHGSNDVANAIGPLSAIFNVLQGNSISSVSFVSPYLLLLGGTAIVIGLATWGWRVIETVGKKITQLTPSRGFAAGFGGAITIVLASKLGLPISTTHVIVGAVLGVGFARGIGAINLNTIRDIVLSWIITIPAGALFAVVFFYMFRWIFG
jgi:phosphate/sulfate permease